MSVFTKKFLRFNSDSHGSVLMSADTISMFATTNQVQTVVSGAVGYQNLYVGLTSNSPSKASGKSTSVATNKLIDSSATFITDGVSVGDRVGNFWTNSFQDVVSVDSETELTFASDLFASTDEFYTIYTPSYALEESMTDNVKKAISSKWRNAVLDFEMPEGVVITFIQ